MRTSSTLLLFSVGLTSSAQWTSDPMMNTSVRSGAGVDAVTPLMASRYDGSTYVSWFDAQPGGYQLRMQLLDADGYPQWDPAGLVVSAHPQNSALFRYDLKVDGLGNAIVAFQDERSGQLDIVAYKIDPTGAMLWGPDGVELTDVGAVQGLAPVVEPLNNDRVAIAWNANDGGSARWIPYQLIDAAGQPVWAMPHQITGPANYSRPQLVHTTNGFLLQYVEGTGNFPYTSNLYVQRFDTTGAALWAQPTHISTRTIPFFDFPVPVSDSNNGLYIAFNTSNPANASLSDVYVQRVKGTGATWSATGTEAITGATTQRFTRGVRLLNWIMGTMVPIQVTNTGQTAGGWSVQGLDTNGVVTLGTTGVEMVPIGPGMATPASMASTGDGIIVAYTEGGFGQQHIRAMRVGVGGNPVWPLPVDLCTVNSNKDDVACGRLTNNDQLVTVWQDDRIGSGVFAQNISADGDIGIITGISGADATTMNVRLLENPSLEPRLLFGADRPGVHTVSMMDMQGKVLATERTAVLAGMRMAPAVGALAPGMYLIRISGPAGVQVLRWVRP